MGSQVGVLDISKHIWETTVFGMSRGRNEFTFNYMWGFHGKVLGKKTEFSSPLIKVSARGGALIHEVQHDLEIYTKRFAPKIIIFHAGVNNVSKTYLYRNEYEQITCALDQTKQLEQELKKFPMVYQGVKIVLSAIVVTKDGFINARSEIVNEQIRSCCRKNNWVYISNHNLTTRLRDSVHLNIQGEDIFAHNIISNVKRVLT